MKKILLLVGIILLTVPTFLFYWNYYNTYSEGNRSGTLQKFSKKGNIFKTYKGELVMSSIGNTNNATIASEKFYFSVKNDSIAKMLFDLEGKRVTLQYEQKRGHLPWHGETNYFIVGIKARE